MSSTLTLSTARLAGTAAGVDLAGELDMDSADQLTAAVTLLIGQGYRDLTLGMSRVTFCDSTGLNALLGLLRKTKAAGGSLTLAAPADPVKRLLTMCGLETLIARQDGPGPGPIW